MYRTEATLRKLFTALPAPGYNLGILGDPGMNRLEAVPSSRVLRMIPYSKYRNANGAQIYMRPTGESCYTLMDNLTLSPVSSVTPANRSPQQGRSACSLTPPRRKPSSNAPPPV